jgi:hypothetical protein
MSGLDDMIDDILIDDYNLLDIIQEDQSVENQKYMLNYTYVFYCMFGEELDGHQDYIYNVLLNFHYPMCMNNNFLSRSKEDKRKIIENEEFYIRHYLNLKNLSVFKIPRVLYDLFFSYFNNIKLKSEINKIKIDFLDNDTINNYNLYCDGYRDYTKTQLNNIFELNALIVKTMTEQNIDYENNITKKDWYKILDVLILNIYIMCKTRDINTCMQKFFYNLQPNKSYEYDLLKTVLDTEISESEHPQIILYRAVKSLTIDEDYASDPLNIYYKGYSISYNTSILNGQTDDTANTYNIELYNIRNMDKTTSGIYKYVLDRFYYGENTINENLLFIPPLHPFIQILSTGEFWHARSKIFNGSVTKGLNKFNNHFNNKSDYDSKPDYLNSNIKVEEFTCYLKKFNKKHRELLYFKDDNKYLKKYLKYKTKYCMLRNIT